LAYPVWGVAWLWQQFRSLSLVQQSLLALLVLGSISTLGWVAWDQWQQRRTERLLALNWKLFEEAAQKLELEPMQQALAKLRELQPEQPLLNRREESLRSGEGDPGDPLMNRYWMNRHLLENNLEKSATEARKRIASSPSDWQARCILADWEFRQKQPSAAIEHLKQLPSVFTVEPPVIPALHRYALSLFLRAEGLLTRTDREDWWEPAMRAMKEYRASRLVPVLRSEATERFTNLDRVQLLESYLGSFEDLKTFPTLPSFWVPASRVAQMILDDPDATPEVLLRLGDVQTGLSEVLKKLAESKTLGEEVQELRADLDERLETTWNRLRLKDPKSLRGFLGLAQLRRDRNQIPQMMQLLNTARKELGASVELLREQIRLLHSVDPQLALREAEKEVQGSQKLEEWYLYCQVAKAAARPDKALDACRQARKLDPKIAWAVTYEAEQLLARERAAEALEVLAPVRSLVPTVPAIARLHLRAYVMSKAESKVQAMLQEITWAEWPPVAVAQTLREVYAPERSDFLLKEVDRLVERAPEVREVRFLQADLYRSAAEPSAGGEWNRKRLDVALDALRWLQVQEPENLQVVNVLCFLQLKGLQTPDIALRSAEPLRQAYLNGRLEPKMQLTLGAIYLQVGRFDEARKLLEVAAPQVNTPGGWIDLGMACYRLNRLNEARAYLQKATTLKRLPRENDDLQQALKMLQGN
jgi:predicted Zn-dependent protease